MKRFTIFTLCALFTTTMFASQRFTRNKEFIAKKEFSVIENNNAQTLAKYVQKSNSNNIWRAAREKAYEWNTSKKRWELYGIYDHEYNDLGYVTYDVFSLREGVPYEDYTYKYDENNEVIEKLTRVASGSNFVNAEKKIFDYDDVVTDYVILNETHNWDENNQEWLFNDFGNKREITRDEQGRVIKFSIAVPFMGSYDETYRTTMSYDEESGEAATYLYESLQYKASDKSFYWQTEFDLRDIEWENTDGQILKEWRELILGNNRVKKATYYLDGEIDGYMLVDYVEGKRDFYVRDTYRDINVVGQAHTLETLDDNGSYREDIYEYFGEFANGNTYHSWAITTCNEHGDVVDYIEYEQVGAGATKTMCHNKFEYKYDEATGAMTEMVQTDLDTSTGTYNLMFKVEYSGITNVATDIENIEANNATLTYEIEGNNIKFAMSGMTNYSICTLSGITVVSGNAFESATTDLSSLASGVYILKVSGTEGYNVQKFIYR